MASTLSCSIAEDVDATAIPAPAELERWVDAALDGQGRGGHVELRVVGEREMAELNGTFRGRPRPTNVLSFPAGPSPAGAPRLLGDLALCAPVIAAEAAEQRKPLRDHWAHLVVHGVLHLLGFDHIDDAGAAEMENLERRILAGLDIPDPYGDEPMVLPQAPRAAPN